MANKLAGQRAKFSRARAILDSAIGFSKYDPETDEVRLVDVTAYDAACVNPPPGMKSEDWMVAGFPGARCD